MIKKLVDKIVETNAPIVVGLDPMMKYLPKHLADVAFEQYGDCLLYTSPSPRDTR
mgnify:CR=1 FL=1